MNGTQRIDRIVAITVALLLTAGCIVVLYPFVSALLWAVILCFVTWPTFLWGVRLLGGRRTLAATLMVLLIAGLLVAPFVAVGLSLADNVSHLTAVISQGLEHGLPDPPAWVADIPLVGHRLHTAWQGLAHDSARLTTALQRLVVPVSTWLLSQGVALDTMKEGRYSSKLRQEIRNLFLRSFMMTAMHTLQTPPSGAVLYLAFELGWTEWKLGFSTGLAGAPRLRTMRARDLRALWDEVARAKKRFGLPADAGVYTCYEAGRDGFWLHRCLMAHSIHNVVVDSASIEVKRRGRRTKTDRLDASKLLTMLIRHCTGEQKVWSVVHVPSVTDEDRRHLHRDLEEMKAERTQHSNRIKGLLASCGLAVWEVGEDFPTVLEGLRRWDGQAVPADLHQRLLREFARLQFVDRQIRDLANERARRIRTTESDPAIEQVRQLLELQGLGPNSAWLFVQEFFAWRQIENRRQLGALAGLTPTPYQSGDSDREQGISKAGNRRLRAMAIEIAWCWVRYQPQSALSQWYRQRFGHGNSRLRRIGIVAVARKLFVQLWQYLKTGALPEGAETISWRVKMTGRRRVPLGV